MCLRTRVAGNPAEIPPSCQNRVLLISSLAFAIHSLATSLQPSDIHFSDTDLTPTSPPAYPLGQVTPAGQAEQDSYLSAFLHLVPLRTFLYSEAIADSMRR